MLLLRIGHARFVRKLIIGIPCLLRVVFATSGGGEDWQVGVVLIKEPVAAAPSSSDNAARERHSKVASC
ncbi:hypothetical protein Poly41_12480 [Novipirellula artificiosorum]|uniref:Uncharacterized protein n=1 Tax=Novipirellula artificiosorum TaxID=2528016 RepID=A0A5C6DZB5_9BACT|nr:hypothetical protein Poly41_12480 [Novipirellula artificiosorum]